MALDLKKAKKYFRDKVISGDDPFKVVDINNPEYADQINFFAVCLKNVIREPQINATFDPKTGKFPFGEGEEPWRRTLNSVRTDKTSQFKSNKNILYRMALAYSPADGSGNFVGFDTGVAGQEKLKSHSDFTNAATDPSLLNIKTDTPAGAKKLDQLGVIASNFEVNKLLSSDLDAVTYECVTKQSFYQWHKAEYIDNTALKQVIKEADWKDKSIINWKKVDVSQGPRFFIAPKGGPFNSGFPTICVVMQQGYDGDDGEAQIRSKENEIINKAAELVGNAFRRTITTNTTNYIVMPHTHKNAVSATPDNIIIRAKKRPLNLANICVGFDYSKVVLQATKPKTEIHKLDAVKVGLNYFIEGKNNASPGLSVSFPTTEKATALETISGLVEKTTANIEKLKNAFENAPPLYIKKDKIDTFAKEIDQFKYDNETIAARGMRNKQYVFSPTQLLEGLPVFYLPDVTPKPGELPQTAGGIVIEAYKKQRGTDPQFKGYTPAPSINETIDFLYDSERNLLAVTAKKNESKEAAEAQTKKTREENNSIPFDIFSFSRSYYPVQSAVVDNSTSFSDGIKKSEALNQALDGDVAFVTDLFVNKFESEYDTIMGSNLQSYADNIYDSSNANMSLVKADLDKNNFFKPDGLNTTIPAVLPYENLTRDVVATIPRDRFLTAKTINSYFIFSDQLAKDLENKGLSEGALSSLEDPQKKVFVPTLQSILDKYHYPPVDIKPSARRDDTELPSEKPKEKDLASAPGSKKVVDVDSYNNAYKAYVQEVLLVEAQTSKYACFNDLAQILAGPGDPLVNLADFLFTKFPWRQLVLELVQGEIQKLKERAAQNLSGLSDMEKALLCIKDIDDLNASFLRLKNAFMNFDRVVEANLPEMPTFPIPYVPFLDFTASFKRRLINLIVEALVKVLADLVGGSLERILHACNDYEGFMQGLESGNKDTSATGKAQQDPSAVAVGAMASQLPGYGEDKINMVNVSIVELLEASGVDTLDNIYNLVKTTFDLSLPNGDLISDRFLTEYFDAVSEIVDATELRSMFVGVAIDEVVNLIADTPKYSLTYLPKEKLNQPQERVSFIFSTKGTVIQLFDLLSRFINLDLINQQLVFGTVIVPDPCLDAGDITDILLDDLDRKGFDLSSLTDETNDINDLINRMCAALESVESNILKKAGIPLISEQNKKDLQSGINATTSTVQNLQETVKTNTKSLFNSSFADLVNYVNGLGLPTQVKPQPANGASQLIIDQLESGPTRPVPNPQGQGTISVPNEKYQANLILEQTQKGYIKTTLAKAEALFTNEKDILKFKSTTLPEYTFNVDSEGIRYQITFESSGGESYIIFKKFLFGVQIETIQLLAGKTSKSLKLVGNGIIQSAQPAYKFMNFFILGLLKYGGKNIQNKDIIPLINLSEKIRNTIYSVTTGEFVAAYAKGLNNGDFVANKKAGKENVEYLQASISGTPTLQQAETKFVKSLIINAYQNQKNLTIPGSSVGLNLNNSANQDGIINSFLEDPKALKENYENLFNDLVDENGSDVSNVLRDLTAYQKTLNALETSIEDPIGGGFKIDAAVQYPNNNAYNLQDKVYFYINDLYYRYNKTGNVGIGDSYPLPIKGSWGSLNGPFDATLYYPPNGKIYFFRGTKYWNWLPTKDNSIAAQGPYNIQDPWSNVGWGPDFPTNIDTAFVWPDKDGAGKHVLYAFKGKEYYRLELYNKGKATPGYPKNIAEHWSGLPDTGFDSAMAYTIPAGQKYAGAKVIYFFKGDTAWVWDTGFNRIWPSLSNKKIAKVFGFPGTTTYKAEEATKPKEPDNPCCKYGTTDATNEITHFKSTSPGDDVLALGPDAKHGEFTNELIKIYDALNGITETEKAVRIIEKISMSEAKRCWMCRQLATFKGGRSFMSYVNEDIRYGIGTDWDLLDGFAKNLKCWEFGTDPFTHSDYNDSEFQYWKEPLAEKEKYKKKCEE